MSDIQDFEPRCDTCVFHVEKNCAPPYKHCMVKGHETHPDSWCRQWKERERKVPPLLYRSSWWYVRRSPGFWLAVGLCAVALALLMVLAQ